MSFQGRWTVNPLNFMKTVNLSVERKTLEVSEAVYDGVVERSPVDTGGFRASWNASVGEPNNEVVVGGSSENPLSPPTFPDLDVKGMKPVYITNNTPYGLELEHGHSDQAPSGMVAATLASL